MKRSLRKLTRSHFNLPRTLFIKVNYLGHSQKIETRSTKQTLTEMKQKYWVCQSSKSWNYVRNITRKCLTSRKLHCKPYNYLKTPSLTKLRLADAQPFSTTGVDNVGPVYVRNMFNRNDREIRKLWVTLYTIQKISRLIEHFWGRWRKEYIVNLREYHSTKQN